MEDKIAGILREHNMPEIVPTKYHANIDEAVKAICNEIWAAQIDILDKVRDSGPHVKRGPKKGRMGVERDDYRFYDGFDYGHQAAIRQYQAVIRELKAGVVRSRNPTHTESITKKGVEDE